MCVLYSSNKLLIHSIALLIINFSVCLTKAIHKFCWLISKRCSQLIKKPANSRRSFSVKLPILGLRTVMNILKCSNGTLVGFNALEQREIGVQLFEESKILFSFLGLISSFDNLPMIF